MSIQTAQSPSNDQAGQVTEKFYYTDGAGGELAGSAEFIVQLPKGSWILTQFTIAAGVNVTHSTTGTFSGTLEKNTDGGTTCLATDPTLDDTETGRVTSDDGAATHTAAVLHGTAANIAFAADDVAFVTLTETGSGANGPLDVSFSLTFERQADFDRDYTVAA